MTICVLLLGFVALIVIIERKISADSFQMKKNSFANKFTCTRTQAVQAGKFRAVSRNGDYDSDFPIHSVKNVTFVSSNKNKIREVKMILGEEFPWTLQTMAIDLNELQATPIEISRDKCQQAVALCKGPVIVEDTSLCFNALNGLPGPYIKWFYESIGNEGLVKMLSGFDDRTGNDPSTTSLFVLSFTLLANINDFLTFITTAYAQCVLSFSMGPGHEILTFVGSTEGDIVTNVTGPLGFGWDPIFIVSFYVAYFSLAIISIAEFIYFN